MSMIEKSLVHYEITAEIGKGGMGEVYQAKDTKLGRDVAIKVLPEEFARDTDRVARFQREAKLLASLNHPNIAAIYGLEESGGTHFLVMELIEGETLKDRIKSGPIPVEEALKLALQMAEALEAAHEKGVIHRDLKPANIKVTPEGKVKILDFGLAKAYAGDQGNINLADSPTISAAATQQGVILGTAAYMSPEQARGKPVDRRADIWAFGVVLYEMLTGKTAFSGDDVTDTLASVVKLDANMEMLPANLHPRVREVINRCLQKEPKKRYSGISDAQYEIEQVLSDKSGVFVQPSLITKPKKELRVGIPVVSAIAFLCLIVAGVAVWYLKPTQPLHLNRSYYELPEDQQFGIHTSPFLGVSPDGRKFVYSTTGGIYVRSLDELDARHISGSDDDAVDMFFSPDGNWIGYWSVNDRQMKKIAISGGAPVTITNAENTAGPIWYEDDTIVYGQQGIGILRISANGGTPETIIKGDGGVFICPQILPGGESVLFTNVTSVPYTIMVQSLKSGERKELVEGDSAQYLSTGHIIYSLDNNLMAVPFDVDKLETVGGPVSIIEGVFRQTAPQWAVSDSGTLVYVPGTTAISQQPSTLVWVDHEGNEDPLPAAPDIYANIKISPDSTRVALARTVNRNQDIWIWDFVRNTMTRLTFDETDDLNPIWTPDSQRIIFGSDRGERASIYWKAADGTGEVEQLASLPEEWIWPMSLSSDGNILFFGNWNPIGLNNIGMLPMEGDRTPQLLLQEKYNEEYPQISPDGRWLAYTSNESGQMEVFIRPFPNVDSGGRWQVSMNGGGGPLWAPDGHELFYYSSDGTMVVSVETEPTFKLGTPQTLPITGPYIGWDISPDGKRFLMLKRIEAEADESRTEESRTINIVLNWFKELKERVPVD